jgi:hypothetical protein
MVGTTTGFPVEIVEAFSPILSPLNPTDVPIVTYEYLFYAPSSDRLRPLAQLRV